MNKYHEEHERKMSEIRKMHEQQRLEREMKECTFTPRISHDNPLATGK